MPDAQVLQVSLYGQAIGQLTRLPNDQNIFTFRQQYIDNSNRLTLSLSFKDIYGGLITELKPTRTRLPPFFSNLLPEGEMREFLARHAGIHPEREFFLLSALGEDLPGAIKIQSTNQTTRFSSLSKKKIKRSLKKDKTLETMHFSLAGVQLKFSAIKKSRSGWTIPVHGVGGSWILKLPYTKYSGVPENEYAMMELAREIGIEVPETSLIPVKQIKGLPKDMEKIGNHIFAIKRFDRGANGAPIHMEDFAQIFGVYPEKKYRSASYRNIAQVIWTEIGEVGIAEFIKRLVFIALIGNADMHLKNWSLIYPNGIKASLAPAYDFVSTIPYLPQDTLALKFMDSKNFNSLHWKQFSIFAAKAMLPEKLVLDTAQATVQKFAEAWRLKHGIVIPKELKKHINTHLKTLPIWKKT